MAHGYAEAVEVLRRDTEPAQFLWRGRLHLVIAVLDHWVEGTAWWRGLEAVALQIGVRPGSVLHAASGPSGTALDTRPLPSSPRWGQRAWGEPAPDVGCAVPSGGLGLPADREVWRVEASAGRSAQPGVYDLTLQPDDDSWLLTAVHD